MLRSDLVPMAREKFLETLTTAWEKRIVEKVQIKTRNMVDRGLDRDREVGRPGTRPGPGSW